MEVNDVNMKTVKGSMTPKRVSYHHGDLRNALLEAALRLVGEQGAEGFSLREAARAVGVSPSAAYRHFADRESLLAALAAQGHAELATAMERAIRRLEAPEGSKERAVAVLAAIGEAYVEFGVRHPSYFRVMFGQCANLGELDAVCAATGRDTFQILVDSLDGLVAAGVVPRAVREGAEIAAWAAVHGLTGLLVDGALELTARGRADAMRVVGRTLLLGLGCDPKLLEANAPVVKVDPRVKGGVPRE